ncbi:hypothetical protein L484_016454 [Morus notabilis]|uniref:Uncharacterized protein n=1 Tax=Morus notabilis TaxID=981085 RepID=W9QXH9_9ROSA|nr:hypothetical protein L484_016454 [Morus notabilis]
MKQSRRVLLAAGVRRRRRERQAERERANEERESAGRERERDRGTRDAAGKGETDKSKIFSPNRRSKRLWTGEKSPWIENASELRSDLILRGIISRNSVPVTKPSRRG